MITPRTWAKYFTLRREGFTMAAAAREAQISYASAKAKERSLRDNAGVTMRQAADSDELPQPIPHLDLRAEAQRALEDFGYFRARYFGRISTPWQEEAGYRVLSFLATPVKEYVIINCPPGSGKSTLFTLDIPAWLTVRNRAIRGMIGSASQTLAERYLVNLRNVLESPFPFQSEPDLIDKGLAVDAEATLAEDFGFFKPPSTTLWSNKAILVAQLGDRQISHKEPTWSAYGLESKLIGGRYDVAVWDDIIDDEDCRTLERIEDHRRRWDKVHEKRLEPGGAIVVPGQRLSPEDIYSYLRSKDAGETAGHDHDCCDAEPGKKYHYIRFRAHWDDRCVGDHGRDAKYWPEGCLLDPGRLPWRELEAEMANGLSNYLQVFQQEDADPAQVLVHPLWISGGTDPSTREIFPGCWDNERDLCELPPGAERPILSVASTDPSPTRFWAHQWWTYSEAMDLRWLMDLERRRMTVGDLLTEEGGRYSGLMEEWWQRSTEIGLPITHWVLEANVAQRFLLQIPYVIRWASLRGVQLVDHQTTARKNDPRYGPQILANLYRFGKVRLPGKQMTRARFTSLKLVEEVTRWPKGAYDDQVMCQWFVESNLPAITPRRHEIVRLHVPSWVGGSRR